MESQCASMKFNTAVLGKPAFGFSPEILLCFIVGSAKYMKYDEKK